jgi:ubiquinone biosynthesis protein COQ9
MNGTRLNATETAETIAESAAALEKSRDRLLLATLPHVAFEGWSAAALRAGCADAGLAAEEGKLIFPDGAREIIDHWSAWSDRQMLETIYLRPDFAALRVRERIAAAVRARIAVNSPWREAVRRTITLLALPPNAGIGLSCTWRTLDAIWYACGDAASDFSFYSKRVTLAGVVGRLVLPGPLDRKGVV